MTQLSRERLEEIAELARKASYKPCAMHMTNLIAVCDSEVIEEMARRLLAAEAQVPVAMRWRWINGDEGPGAWWYHDTDHFEKLSQCEDRECELVYAAPQPVAVPDDVLKRLLPDAEKYEFWFEHDGKILFEGVKFNDAVFEACRAAMQGKADGTLTNEGTKNHLEDKLDMADHSGGVTDKGNAEPVSQPYKLPDDTRRLDWLDAQNKRLNEYYGTSYGWKFDANFQRNAMMLNDSNYPVMNVRQAIDEAMRTAPQEPTK